MAEQLVSHYHCNDGAVVEIISPAERAQNGSIIHTSSKMEQQELQNIYDVTTGTNCLLMTHFLRSWWLSDCGSQPQTCLSHINAALAKTGPVVP